MQNKILKWMVRVAGRSKIVISEGRHATELDFLNDVKKAIGEAVETSRRETSDLEV